MIKHLPLDSETHKRLYHRVAQGNQLMFAEMKSFMNLLLGKKLHVSGVFKACFAARRGDVSLLLHLTYGKKPPVA